jgi:hypothetical protein
VAKKREKLNQLQINKDISIIPPLSLSFELSDKNRQIIQNTNEGQKLLIFLFRVKEHKQPFL